MKLCTCAYNTAKYADLQKLLPDLKMLSLKIAIKKLYSFFFFRIYVSFNALIKITKTVKCQKFWIRQEIFYSESYM